MSLQSDKILELIAVAGEMPSAALRRLPIKPSYRYRLISDLKERKLIRLYSRDGLRGYKLTSAAKRLLMKDYPKRFLFFLAGTADTNVSVTDYNRRYRLHRTAEVIATLSNASVNFFPDEKSNLFGEATIASPTSKTFYFSREMKDIGEEHIKIRSSRATGVLFTEDEILLTYNTGSNLMKWEYQTELRCKAMLTGRFCQSDRAVYDKANVVGLMTGSSMKTALALLTSTGSRNRLYFRLDETFTKFYFLPNNSEGESLLKILCSAEARYELRELLLSDLANENPELPMEHDAVDSGGLPVLLAYEFDMERIRRFRKSLELFDMRGVVYCFDFQQAVLSEYFGSLVKIQAISMEKVKSSGLIRCF